MGAFDLFVEDGTDWITYKPFLVTLIFSGISASIFTTFGPQAVDDIFPGDPSEAASELGSLYIFEGLLEVLSGPVVGSASDTFGRRPLYFIALGCYVCKAIFFTVAIATRHMVWIVVGSLIHALCASSTALNCTIAIDCSPLSSRAQNLGLLAVPLSIGFVLGPMAGGLLATYGLAAPFTLAILANVCALMMMVFVVKESHPLPRSKRPDFRIRNALPTAALGLLAKATYTRQLTVALCLKRLGYHICYGVVVLWLKQQYKLTGLQMGAIFSLQAMFLMLSQTIVCRWVVTHMGERYGALLGTASYCGSCFLLTTQPPLGFLLLLCMIGFAMGSISDVCLRSIISKCYPADQQGTVLGSIQCVDMVVKAAAPVFGLLAYSHFTSPEAPVHFVGMPFLMAALSFLGSISILYSCFKAHPEEMTHPISAASPPSGYNGVGFTPEDDGKLQR